VVGNATDEHVVEVRDDKVGIVHLEIKHAHMSFYLVAESQKDFDNWMTAQAQSSLTPTNAQTVPGTASLPHPRLRPLPYLSECAKRERVSQGV
jgi:hypothetical protein